jgi:hypothetical protein
MLMSFVGLRKRRFHDPETQECIAGLFHHPESWGAAYPPTPSCRDRDRPTGQSGNLKVWWEERPTTRHDEAATELEALVSLLPSVKWDSGATLTRLFRTAPRRRRSAPWPVHPRT